MTENKWKSINELRKVNKNYSGMRYSVKYAKEVGIIRYRYCELLGKNPTVGVCEKIKIRLDSDKGILYRICKVEGKNTEYKSEFHTQLGIFQNDNRGEFGGLMRTPTGDYVHGNFEEVVDHKNKVYAVDSLSHLGYGHFRLLEFSEIKQYREIYSTKVSTDDLRTHISLEYGALFNASDALYFVISGYVATKDEEYVGHTKLLKVQNSKVEEIFSVDEEFWGIENLVVFEKSVYVSMDKMVVHIDLNTGSLEYYTNISELAEMDLLEVQGQEEVV